MSEMQSAMEEVLKGFSRAMYSNWMWHRPLQLLIDAGEGLQLALAGNVFSPSVLAITHGHSDHVMGIPGLIASRRFGTGAVDKPLTVYYPDQSRGVQGVRELLGISYAGVVFPVTWTALSPGAIVPLGKTRSLHAFAVRHTAGEPALGYKVVETRRRLKAEFAALPQSEVEALAREGRRDELVEEVPHITFAHSGDAMPLDPALVAGADLLVHDATFLSEPDRREPIHATTEEALDVARAADVKTLILYHLSIRYDRSSAIPLLKEQVTASRFAGECWLLDEGEFISLKHRNTETQNPMAL